MEPKELPWPLAGPSWHRSEAMAYPTNEQIRLRARELWEQAGKPEGKDDDFWNQAQQELQNEDKSSPLRTPDNL